MTDEKNLAQLNYEEAFSELQNVIATLEAGDKPLDEALSLYTRGQQLYAHCIRLLDDAELKVQQLNNDGEMEDFAS